MRCQAVLKLGFDGAMAKSRLAAAIYVNNDKINELIQQLVGLGLVRVSPDSGVQLTADGIKEFENLKGSKIVAKSEAGAGA